MTLGDEGLWCQRVSNALILEKLQLKFAITERLYAYEAGEKQKDCQLVKDLRDKPRCSKNCSANYQSRGSLELVRLAAWG